MTTIFVNQTHIDHGRPGTCTLCPIALAIQEATGIQQVGVNIVEVRIDGKYFDLPREVTEFINQFDAGGSVEPFEFELCLG